MERERGRGRKIATNSHTHTRGEKRGEEEVPVADAICHKGEGS